MTNLETDWWVYLVRCGDQSLYTGVTTDLVRRVTSIMVDSRAVRYTGRGALWHWCGQNAARSKRSAERRRCADCHVGKIG